MGDKVVEGDKNKQYATVTRVSKWETSQWKWAKKREKMSNDDSEPNLIN